MSLIRINKEQYTTKSGLDANTLVAHVSGGSGYSVEGKELVSSLKDGSFENKIQLGAIAEKLKTTLSFEAAAVSTNGAPDYSFNSRQAGLASASLIMAFAADPASYQRACISFEQKALPEGSSIANATGLEHDSISEFYSKESFDNQNLVDSLFLSVGLNYKIARQGPAMDMMYRPLPMTPDQGAFDIEIPCLYVQNNVKHAQDGSPSDFGLRRVLDAAIDHEILNDNATAIIPGYNDVTKENFVETAVVEPFEKTEGRRVVTTSALKVNRTINLFGLGNVDNIQRVGQADYSEALDRNIGVASVFLRLGSDTLVVDTRMAPYSRFYKGPEQGGRSVKLSFPVTLLELNKDSLNYLGEALTAPVFQTIATGKYTVRCKFTLNGDGDVERGTVSVNPSQVEVMSIYDELGGAVSLTGTIGKGIVDGLQAIVVSGWYPDARLTNSNHRYLGLQLNTRPVRERLLSRTRAPFFVPYPLGEERDQTVLDQLTYVVGQYTNNEGIGTMIGYHERTMRLTNGGLRGNLTMGDFELNSKPIEGISRWLINPYVVELNVDFRNAQSLETSNNVENACETLYNVLRSAAFDGLQRSNYETVCRFVDGGEVANKWRLAIVTSPKIKRFLTLQGDSRTLGADLPFQLESDIDNRMVGKLYMGLVRDGDGFDPMSNGIMLLTPTMVTTITATRDNSPRKEAVVQPRFQHYQILPWLIKVNVFGVDELLESTLPFRVENRPVEAFGGSTIVPPVVTPTPTPPVTGGDDSGAGTGG